MSAPTCPHHQTKIPASPAQLPRLHSKHQPNINVGEQCRKGKSAAAVDKKKIQNYQQKFYSVLSVAYDQSPPPTRALTMHILC